MRSRKLKSRDEAGASRTPSSWHALEEESVYRKLRTIPEGLDPGQVDQRLQQYGENILPGREIPSLFQVVLHQFASPLIYILLIAGTVSAAIGDIKDALFIFGVIGLNAAMGTVQEWQAEKSAHALQSLLKIRSRVKRAGEVHTIPAEDLVPGDVILIESGDKVPADIRLITANNLSVDEAFLTGESFPVIKNTGSLRAETVLTDRSNMAYAGATVTAGRGTGLAVATGSHTEVGKIAGSISEKRSAEAPLVIRMKRFSRQISVVVLVFAVLLGIISAARGIEPREVFFTMIAMAVSAIPEGLPVAMTVALSLATARMARRKVIARKLVAVESLGSCTAIASDKTGTLTLNEQTVKRVVFPDHVSVDIGGQGYNGEGRTTLPDGSAVAGEVRERLRGLATHVVLCNEASMSNEGAQWRHSGDAMDVALLALAYKLGADPSEIRRRHPLIAEIPFESERRFSAVAYQSDEQAYLVAKGAVETILSFCSRMQTASEKTELDDKIVRAQEEGMTADGYRVLAVAMKQLAGPQPDAVGDSSLADMVLVGLVAFIDPLRPEARDAVALAHDAGVKVLMITGDHPATALAIARDLGIADSTGQALTGDEMEILLSEDTPEFHERLQQTHVFARVTPRQKLGIVESLMELGDFVAVTGDGVNDAPALSRANIGVAMGSGTDVAKDAAQIIVADDNFASIVGGIEEGRYAYANVRKVTLLLISTGFAELVLISGAVLANLPSPFLAVQILWLNLVTNGIQDVALAFESGEKEIIRLGPRRPTEGIFNRRMVEQVLAGGLTMAFVCLAAWAFLIRSGMETEPARNILLALLILMQSYHVLNSRSEYRSAFGIPLRNNPILLIGMVVAFAMHVIATQLTFTQSMLSLSPLRVEHWLILAGIAASVMASMEIYKGLRK